MNVIVFLNQRSKHFPVALGLLLVASLGVLNYLSGPDVTFLIFYIAPVFLAAWFVGRAAGLWMCVASGVSWVAVSELWSEHYSTRAVPYWNAAVSLGFLVFLNYVFSALKRAHEQERERARTDYLTGAVNGRHFTELAANEINRAQRHAHPLSVAYMDVDDFKLVNDRLGHSVGDKLLRAAAETIRERRALLRRGGPPRRRRVRRPAARDRRRGRAGRHPPRPPPPARTRAPQQVARHLQRRPRHVGRPARLRGRVAARGRRRSCTRPSARARTGFSTAS